MIEASPCRQAERRKHIVVDVPKPNFNLKGKLQDYESPKSRVIETKPSIASTANSIKFGDERMIKAKHGLLERQSLENTVLIADGEEDLSTSCKLLVKCTCCPAHQDPSPYPSLYSSLSCKPLTFKHVHLHEFWCRNAATVHLGWLFIILGFAV